MKRKKCLGIILCVMVVLVLGGLVAAFLPVAETTIVTLQFEAEETFLQEEKTELQLETQKTQAKPVQLWETLFDGRKYNTIADPAELEKMFSEEYLVTGVPSELDGKQLYTLTVTGGDLVQTGSFRDEKKRLEIGSGEYAEGIDAMLAFVSAVKFVYVQNAENAWELKAVANRVDVDAYFTTYVWRNATEKSGKHTAEVEDYVILSAFDRAEELAVANDSGKVQNFCIGEVTVEVTAPVKCSVSVKIPAPNSPADLIR